jgi:hypothetical protein
MDDYNAGIQSVLSLIQDYLDHTDNMIEESLLYHLQEDVNKLLK